MKQIYIPLVAICVVLLTGGELTAQNQMTITGLKNTDWGEIVNCNCTKSLLLSDTGTGEVQIEAKKNSTIVVNINYPAALQQNSGTDAIPYSTPRAAYNNNDTNDKTGATDFSGDQSTETISVPNSKGGTTNVYIYIFGELSLNFPNAGTYSNNITVSATYQ